MKGFHFFCQWPPVIWIKHWFYRKFSHCVRDDSLPPQKLCARVSSQRNAEPRREGWRRWETEQRVRTEEMRGGGIDFKRTTLKREEGDRRGHREPRRETRKTRGMRRKNKGFGELQLREEGGRGRKTQRWMRQGSHRIERGKGFLKCSVQISLLLPSLSNTCHNSSL